MPVNAGFGNAIVSFANDILSGDVDGCVYGLGADASRKGFRETGRGGGSKGERWLSDGEGETARLRNGLLEERLRLRVEEGRRPMTQARDDG